MAPTLLRTTAGPGAGKDRADPATGARSPKGTSHIEGLNNQKRVFATLSNATRDDTTLYHSILYYNILHYTILE